MATAWRRNLLLPSSTFVYLLQCSGQRGAAGVVGPEAPAPTGSGTRVFGCLQRLQPLGLELQLFFCTLVGSLDCFSFAFCGSSARTVKWAALNHHTNTTEAGICSARWCRNVYFPDESVAYFAALQQKRSTQWTEAAGFR